MKAVIAFTRQSNATTLVHCRGWGGKKKEMLVHANIDELREAHRACMAGAKVQDALPYCSPDEREFMLSGTLPSEWDMFYPAEEEA